MTSEISDICWTDLASLLRICIGGVHSFEQSVWEFVPKRLCGSRKQGKHRAIIRVRNNDHLLIRRTKYQQINHNKSESRENNIILKRKKKMGIFVCLCFIFQLSKMSVMLIGPFFSCQPVSFFKFEFCSQHSFFISFNITECTLLNCVPYIQKHLA